MIRLDARLCLLCGACEAVCPARVYRVWPATVEMRAERCTGCGRCVRSCPGGALRLDEV